MKIIRLIKSEIIYLKNKYSFWRMKRKAIRLHELTGKRYHVIPVTETSLMVVDNTFVKAYNKTINGRNNRITFHDLINLSYYSTPVQGITRNNNN